jgi:hypothetical protein
MIGRTDWVTTVAAADTIASLIPNAKLVVFEKSGHSPQIEEFDLFQKVMRDFLATLSNSPTFLIQVPSRSAQRLEPSRHCEIFR